MEELPVNSRMLLYYSSLLLDRRNSTDLIHDAQLAAKTIEVNYELLSLDLPALILIGQHVFLVSFGKRLHKGYSLSHVTDWEIFPSDQSINGFVESTLETDFDENPTDYMLSRML